MTALLDNCQDTATRTMEPHPDGGPKLRRIRTIRECIELIKEADPNTAFSRRYLREVCMTLPGTIRRGRFYWVDYDQLLQYLNDPRREERDRLRHYEESRSCIRRVEV